MAKKKKKAPSSGKKSAQQSDLLPQNILQVGEETHDDKRIYISQPVYQEIQRFTRDKTKNESGGVLLGSTTEAFGKTHILIRGFLEAKHCEATPTTLTFTHESWDYIHREAEKRFPGDAILGWIHTHPDFGIFLSDYDKFIHENYFSGENQIAYVVDPIRKTEGFYIWVNGRIEQTKGFCIYDKTGAKLKAPRETGEQAVEGGSGGGISRTAGIVIGLLCAAVLGLLVYSFSLSRRISKLETRQTVREDEFNAQIGQLNQGFGVLYNQVLLLQDEVDALRGQVAALTPAESEAPVPEGPADTGPPEEASTEAATDLPEEAQTETAPGAETSTAAADG